MAIRVFMRRRSLPCDLRAQICYAGCLTPRKHVEGNHVVKPVVTGTVEILGCNGDRVLMRGKPAIEAEIDFEFFTRIEAAEIDLLDLGVGAVNIHADAVADEDTDHRLGARLVENGAYPDGDALAARRRRRTAGRFH